MSKDIYGLVGESIQHSLSPHIHNKLFTENDIDAEYRLFDVKELTSVIKRLKNKNIKGLNITKPFKTEIVNHIDDLGKDVKEIGSSNTLSRVNGKIKGYNTDGIGAKKALERFTEIGKKRVLQIGAGGAGRAIAYEMARFSKVILINRTLKKAKSLEKFGVEAKPFRKKTLKKEIEKSDILINTTSVGMKEEKSPIDPNILNEDTLVFDIVYTPLKTKLLRDAEKVGCETIDGLWMLIYQAVQAFQIWTGLEPDPGAVRRFLTEEIR